MSYNTNYPQNALPIPQFSQMLQNWNALNTTFDKDHTLFSEPDTNKIGHHKQVFYNAPLAAPVPVPTGTQAASFTMASVAPGPVGVSQAVYKNSTNALYLLSCIKAWGSLSNTAAIQDGFNLNQAMTTNTGLGTYVVTFATALPNANYAVLATTQMAVGFAIGGIIGVDVKTAANFQVNIRAVSGAFGASIPFSFVVLQT